MSSALTTRPEPAPVAKVSQPRLTNTALLMGACDVLLLGPLAFGAVEPWSIFALEACAMLLLAVWAYKQWINRELNVSDHVLYRPMAALFCAGAGAVAGWNDGLPPRDLLSLTALRCLRMFAFVVTQTLHRSSQFELVAKLFTGVRGGSGFVCRATGFGAEWKAVLDPGLGAGWLHMGPTSITIITPCR